MLFLCSRYVERAHGGHPSVENTVYQRSDLLHRTDDSQDNYSQPKQQASKCVRTNAETHKMHTVHVCISDSSTYPSCAQTITYVMENKAYCPHTESLLLG